MVDRSKERDRVSVSVLYENTPRSTETKIIYRDGDVVIMVHIIYRVLVVEDNDLVTLPLPNVTIMKEIL